MSLHPGTEIGKYVVLRKLAEGGMAEVYLCAARGPEGFEKEVAIKRIRSALADDPSFVEMFVHEARLASKLNHANVVQIFDFAKHEDSYYLAMEYVRGRSLWDVRRRAKERMQPVPPLLAAQIGVEVARGLSYAHRLSDNGQPLEIVHRDVTPHNVLISYDGAVKLTDFGIAKAGNRLTAAGVLKGKFAYMSPEQARGERVDCRTDVFALGIVVWELLTGGRLFEGDSDVATLRAVQESNIAPPRRLNPDVPELVDQAVMRALARDRSERFQSAQELERALAECVLRCARSLDEVDIGAFLRKLFAQELADEARAAAAARAAQASGLEATSAAAQRRAAPSGTLVATPAPPSAGAPEQELSGSLERTYVKPAQVFAPGDPPAGAAAPKSLPPSSAPIEAPKVIVDSSLPTASLTPTVPSPGRQSRGRVALIAGCAGLLGAAAVVGVIRPWRTHAGAGPVTPKPAVSAGSGGANLARMGGAGEVPAARPAAAQAPTAQPAGAGPVRAVPGERRQPSAGKDDAAARVAAPTAPQPAPGPGLVVRPAPSRAGAGAQPAPAAEDSSTAAAVDPPSTASGVVQTEGVLLLKIRPWATVFIDGKRWGSVQALGRINLPPGKHAVRLKQGHRTWKSSVEIQPGKTAVVEHDMRAHH